WLRIDEISFLIHFLHLLIGEDTQSRLTLHDRKGSCAVENRQNRLVIMDRRNELRVGQAFQYFFLEKFRAFRPAIRAAARDLAAWVDEGAKHDRSVLLPLLNEIGSIDPVN